MRRLHIAASMLAIVGGIVAGVAGSALLAAAPASAFPGYCPGGGAGYGGFGGYCDGPTYADGSYDHTVMVLGGWQASRVCPPSPANPAFPMPWAPGQICEFRK